MRQQINDSVINPLTGVQTKMDNKLKYLEKKQSVDTLSDQIDNKIAEQYDIDFYNKYDKTNDLNRRIMTQDTIINTNNSHAAKYDTSISILKSMIAGLVIIVLVYLFYTVSGNKKLLMWGTTIVVFLNVIYILFRVIRRKTDRALNKIKKLSEATGRGIVKATALNLLSPRVYRCPKDCRRKHHHHKKPGSDLSMSSTHNPDYDSSYAPDITGDIPSALGYNIMGPNPLNPEIKKQTLEYAQTPGNEPQPAYMGVINYKKLPEGLPKDLDRKVTCYECKWNGTEGKNEYVGADTVKSTIPCKHLPGYDFKDKSMLSAFKCLNNN